MRELETALSKLHKYVRDKALFPGGAKLLLACSGGADSVALAVLFARLRSLMHVTLLAVHVDHQLRGIESEADAELVKELCQRLNIPLIVRKIKLEGRRDLENQARRKRFKVLEQLLEIYRFDYIVTGHHQNDQAETMLMNLFRGAGITGLAGIKPSLGKVLHPLLCFEKQELIDLLTAEKIEWREDSSNQDEHFRRNRIRHQLLPMIESTLNPAAIRNLSLQAEVFWEAEKLLKQNCQKQLKKLCLEQDGERIALYLPGLMALGSLEQYYVLRQAMEQLSGSGRDFFRHSFEEILRLVASAGSKRICLGNGIQVLKQYDRLLLLRHPQKRESPEPFVVEEDRSRAVYGALRFTFQSLRVLPRHRDENGYSVYLDADKLHFPFTIRSRRDGDRFMPLGMKQLKKLKEFLIDAKVPRFERDQVPLLDDGEKIFWVVGQRIDERVKITDQSANFLHISAEPVHDKPKRPANRIKTQGEQNEPDELRYFGSAV